MALINFQCRKCKAEFDCETWNITFGDILEFEKDIICPKCGRLNKEEIWLTELGQTQIGELYFSEGKSILELCDERGTGFDAIGEDVKEVFYPILFAIEETIYLHYQKDKSLGDLDLIISLKKLRDNIFSENTAFNTFEENIINKIKMVLSLNSYSKKDIIMSISKVLNSVKLHRFMGGKRGYLVFISEFFGKSGEDYF